MANPQNLCRDLCEEKEIRGRLQRALNVRICIFTNEHFQTLFFLNRSFFCHLQAYIEFRNIKSMKSLIENSGEERLTENYNRLKTKA